jgi:hypothetical protein
MAAFGLYMMFLYNEQGSNQLASGQDRYGRCVTSNVSYLERRLTTGGDQTIVNLCPGDRVRIARGSTFGLTHIRRANEPSANVMSSNETCRYLQANRTLSGYDAYLCVPSGLNGDGMYMLNIGASYNNIDKWPAGLQFEITRRR